MADIDNLTIQISAEANAAIQALNNLASALKSVNRQLNRLDPSRLNDVASAADNVNSKTADLGKSGKAIKDLADNLSKAGKRTGSIANIGNDAQGTASKIEKASSGLKGMTRALKGTSNAAGSSGGGFSSFVQSVKNLGHAISNSNTHLGLLGKTAKLVFKTIAAPAILATKAVKGLGKANDATAKTAKTLAKELTRVSKMLKLMVTRMALRAVIKEVGNGFKSLALHSEEFNQSVSNLMNGAKKLGYSFSAMISPLINAFAPAILYVINLLIKLANVIQQVFGALTGAGTWNKAKDFTNNWADDIKAANKQAKELKKTVLGFDELNQLQEKTQNSGGGTANDITDMFETLPIEDKWQKLADYIKKTANKLFEPIKKAWEKVGDFVKKSWKYAMNEIKKLGESVARDFWKVWEQQATQQIFENILKIIGYIGQTVGNLAKRFREAWDKNNTGYKILCNIRDVVLTITEHIKNMAKATADWADSLDFSPILEKFNEWLKSIKPVVDNLMGIVEDFYTTVILPLGKWAIEDGAPQLLKVFIDFNEKVDWDGLRSKLQKLWEHLAPFAKTVGEGLIIFIDRCAQALADFLNSQEFEDFIDAVCRWMDNVDAQDVANGLEMVAKAILGFAIGKAVVNGLIAVSNFINLIKSVAPLLKLAIVVSVAITGLEAGKTIGEKIFPDDKELYEHYKGITGSLNLIKDFAIAVVDAFKMYFTSAWDLIVAEVKYKIERLKAVVSKIFTGSYDTEGFEKARSDYENAKKKYAIAAWIDDEEVDTLDRFTKKLEEAKGKMSETSKEVAFMSDKTKSTMGELRQAADALDNATGKSTSFGAELAKMNDKAKNAEQTFMQTRNGIKSVADETDKAAKVTPVLTEKQRALDEVFKNVKDKAEQYADSHKKVSDGYKTLNDEAAKVKTGLDNVKIAQENVTKQTPVFNKEQQDIIKTLQGVQTENTKLAENTKVSWNNIDTDVAKAGTSINGTYGEITKGMDDTTKDLLDQTDKISKAFSEDKWTFDGVGKGLSKTFEAAKEGIKKTWNVIADKLNGEHEIGGSKLRINLPKFATGGFPEDGLFLASHHELVGSFSNGKTAVANNEQIVQGISAGVYNAVTSAMANSNGNGGYIANTIVVDGEVIARTITKAQQKQQMRFSPNMG